MPSFRENSRRMALCGVLAALALVFLSLGGIVPAATFCCPILAMLCALPVVEEYGAKTTLLFYGAVSLLALLLTPDKEVALLYAFLGWYPALRPIIDRRIPDKLPRAVVKLALFAAAVSALYALAVPLLGMDYIAAEYTAAGQIMVAAMAVMGGAIWFLFDKVLARFALLYRKKWRKKFFRP